MATLVCFHAHPDDEALATGGTMARAAASGHRVVLITATRGEHGEVPDGYLLPGEPLWQRRSEELAEAARILGVARQEFLGYEDSGMAGESTNEAPAAFCQADVEEAAARLAAVLAEEHATALTVYDDHGVYGHPDHIQVHRVGIRAAELAGTRWVFEATLDRDHLRELVESNVGLQGPGGDIAAEFAERGFEGIGRGSEAINTVIDVRPWIDVKRRAIFAHASQIHEATFVARMPEEAFAAAFGQEWFSLREAPPTWRGDDLLEGLPE